MAHSQSHPPQSDIPRLPLGTKPLVMALDISDFPLISLLSDVHLASSAALCVQERVIGQEDAVTAVSTALKRARVGLKDPSRPIAALMFCGPTGVGKTELTKVHSPSLFVPIV